jgi:hypothetical protein
MGIETFWSCITAEDEEGPESSLRVVAESSSLRNAADLDSLGGSDPSVVLSIFVFVFSLYFDVADIDIMPG